MFFSGKDTMKVAGAVLLVAATGFSQAIKNPATRVHVKVTDGVAKKYTSKLATIVELNFTMNNGHQPGKKIIADGLDRVATAYGGLKVRHHTTASDGSVKGVVPNFTLDSLLAGEVIVSNNISAMGDAAIGTAKQNAIKTAIETNGKGYLAFHGSGDNQSSGWAWFTNTLHPMSYQGHENRTPAPVYKHLATAKHIIMDSILLTKTTSAIVPNEINDAGVEQLSAAAVAVRGMKNEWYRFGRDISRDASFKDKVTILLKYDPRALGASDLDPEYKRKGGNMYTYLYKVGTGMTSYIPAGHENDELLDANTGFDGGTGDYDRYVAQTLFFLAGYAETACDASCMGLPIVDANNFLTGEKWTGSTGLNGKAVAMNPELNIHPGTMGFFSNFDENYEAKVTDIHGRVIFQKSGEGKIDHRFDQSSLKPGVYFMTVRIGKSAPQVKRYALLPASI